MACCFFDIDGTIAEDGVFVDGILASFKELRKNGHHVYICSGRAFHYVDAFAKGYVDGYITSNGRCGYHREKRIYHKPLSKQEIRNYAKEARKFDALLIFQGEQHRLLLEEDQAQYTKDKNAFHLQDVQLWKGEELYNFNVYYQQEETLSQLRAHWQGKIVLNDHHNGQSADASICDFDKGDGVLSMVSYLQEKKEDTYAFGDGENDIAMFRSCAHRIAMGNAVDALKKEATYVSDHYQQRGVRNALFHFQLLKEGNLT